MWYLHVLAWLCHVEFESSLLSLLEEITHGATVIISHSGQSSVLLT